MGSLGGEIIGKGGIGLANDWRMSTKYHLICEDDGQMSGSSGLCVESLGGDGEEMGDDLQKIGGDGCTLQVEVHSDMVIGTDKRYSRSVSSRKPAGSGDIWEEHE